MDREQRIHLGRVVREARERLGLTQEQLGQRIGNRTHDTISNIERGRTIPSLTTLSSLSRVLEVPLWRFVTDQNLVPAPDHLGDALSSLMDLASRLDASRLRTLKDVAEALAREQDSRPAQGVPTMSSV